jgi:hypothetical protein
MAPAKPSALVDTRVIYCGDRRSRFLSLEQLQKLPPACVDRITIAPPFHSNRNYEGPSRTGIIWSETKEKRAFEDRHESTRAYIDYMCPRCVEMARVLKKTCG